LLPIIRASSLSFEEKHFTYILSPHNDPSHTHGATHPHLYMVFTSCRRLLFCCMPPALTAPPPLQHLKPWKPFSAALSTATSQATMNAATTTRKLPHHNSLWFVVPLTTNEPVSSWPTFAALPPLGRAAFCLS